LADVFLSYNREDLAVARRFAEGFERAGLTVWWDQTLSPGEAYDHVTEKALKQARAVVVLWSPRSVVSRWVRAEATLAERNRTLAPVMIESCERPIMFELTQTADLSHWSGDPGDPAWQQFLASVQRMIGQGASGAEAPVASLPPASSSGSPYSGSASWGRRAVMLAVAAVLILALVYAGFRFNREDKAPEASASTARPDAVAAAANLRPRLAVLPFENFSPDPANAFFTDGLYEEVLTALFNSGAALDVISRTTMMTYRDNPKSVPDIGRELNADYVVEGSVRRDKDEVRLTLQLINAKTDSHVWSQNFDRKLINAMTLQSEVASAVASQLAVKVSPAAILNTAPPTRDPIAYDLYLQAKLGARLLSGGSSDEAIRKVTDLLGQAIARDPEFGLAYLERVAMGPVPGMSIESWKEGANKDLVAARRLLGNDPRIDLFEAINSIGGPWEDPARTLPLFAAAEARGLNDPEILNGKGTVLMAAGRVEEALELRRRLVSLDPANPRLLLSLAADSFIARQPAEALKAIEMMIRQLPPEYAPMWEGFSSETRFQFTGDRRYLDVLINAQNAPGFEPALLEDFILRGLRLEGRFGEILQRLEKIKDPLMPSDSLFQSYNLGQSPPPVARIRGWTHLLMGDQRAARADGREVLSFRTLAEDGEAGRAGWLERLRRAEGHLFAGEPEKAAALAREGMAMMPRSRNALLWDYATAMGAAILAWSGNQDEAAGLLETLGTGIPGLAPASITRDPVYAMPLKDNARYQALSARLEAQMAATRL